MSNLRQAAQQALEALTLLQGDIEWTSKSPTLKFVNSTVAALRQALAEPEQKVWCDCGDSIEPDSGAKCGNCVAGDSAEPEQEPVAWMDREGDVYKELPSPHWCPPHTPLYAHPPTPRRPLTDEEIADLWDGHTVPVFGKTGINPIVFARAIERKHGIGGDA